MLEKLNQYFEEIQGYSEYKISFWGNDYTNAILLNYDFFDSENRLHDMTYMGKEVPDYIFIVGALNHSQALKLKEYYDENKSESLFVVKVSGSLDEKLLKKSSLAVSNIEEYIPIDYEYNKFPIDIPELMIKTKEMRR